MERKSWLFDKMKVQFIRDQQSEAPRRKKLGLPEDRTCSLPSNVSCLIGLNKFNRFTILTWYLVLPNRLQNWLDFFGNHREHWADSVCPHQEPIRFFLIIKLVQITRQINNNKLILNNSKKKYFSLSELLEWLVAYLQPLIQQSKTCPLSQT